MKHLLVVLAFTLGLTTPLFAQTGGNSSTVHSPEDRAGRARQNALINRAIKQHMSIAFITTYVPTGSHIPQVAVYYNGHFYRANDFSVGSVYSGRAIEASGALDVGSALSALDPAISITGGR